MKPVIEVNQVWKEYNKGIDRRYKSLRDTFINLPNNIWGEKKEKFWALQDINFQVEAGESIGIIGRNGAGKSTLLKILSRITPPTKGSITLRGRVASLLEVGTGFHPELTGRENIYFNGSILGMKNAEIKRKFDEIVDFSGVESFIDTPLKHYSSGMQMRLAFSVAAIFPAEITIIDEVLAVGDFEFQKKSFDKISSQITSGNKTFIVVSHSYSQLSKIGNHFLHLDYGKQIRIGDKCVLQNYFNVQNSEIQIPNPIVTDCKIMKTNVDQTQITLDILVVSKITFECDMMIGINNLDNFRIANFVTYRSNWGKKINQGNNELSISISTTNINFKPGHYHLDFKLLKSQTDIIVGVGFKMALEIPYSEFISNENFYGNIYLNGDVKQNF